MNADLLEMFGISLLLTIGIELLAAFLLGIHDRKGMLLVILVNVLTNPPAVLCNWLCRLYWEFVPMAGRQIVIEVIVVITEACIYRSFMKDPQWKIKHPGWLSIVANGASWCTGVLLFR